MYLMNRIFDESLCVATVIVSNILVIERTMNETEEKRRCCCVTTFFPRELFAVVKSSRAGKIGGNGENKRAGRKKTSQTNEEEKNIDERKVYPFTVGKEKKFGRYPYAFLFYPRAQRVIPSAEGYYVFGLLN